MYCCLSPRRDGVMTAIRGVANDRVWLFGERLEEEVQLAKGRATELPDSGGRLGHRDCERIRVDAEELRAASTGMPCRRNQQSTGPASCVEQQPGWLGQ